jgi:hypothetical protein
MSENETAFIQRMEQLAAHKTDSGHTMIDTDDLRRLIEMARPKAQQGKRSGKPGPSRPITTSKSSIAVIEAAAKKYANALKRLADK